MFDICETMNASLLGSKMHSAKSSPGSVSLSSSLCGVPYREEVVGESNQTNDDLTEEISSLREQVEVLTCECQFLATELERTSNQLNESTALFQAESEKNNAAMASMKCLTSQENIIIKRRREKEKKKNERG